MFGVTTAQGLNRVTIPESSAQMRAGHMGLRFRIQQCLDLGSKLRSWSRVQDLRKPWSQASVLAEHRKWMGPRLGLGKMSLGPEFEVGRRCSVPQARKVNSCG